MTTISQYLRAEQVDKAEPCDFYIPGSDDWRDPSNQFRMRGRVARYDEADELYLVGEEDDYFG